MKTYLLFAGLGVAMMTQAAVAQTGEDLALQELPVTTEAQLQELVGGPILRSDDDKYRLTSDPQYDLTNNESLFVLEEGSVKSSGMWTAADSEACKASGGIELEISAGRIACFAL